MNNSMRRNLARRGFTLIELMIVVAIIGVLSAIAVPSFAKAKDKANLRACHANQKTIAGAIEMWNLDNSSSVKDLDDKVAEELVKGGYITSKVDDPGAGKDTFKNYKLVDGGITCATHGAFQGKKEASAASSSSSNG